MSEIAANWQQVVHNVTAVAQRAGRDPDEIKIIAVTKTVDPELIRDALNAGAMHLGENRVQEALPKIATIGDGPSWHFIGRLQSNKAKDVLGRFDLIHSLDRESLAEELDRRAAKQDLTVNCLLEVNVASESTKAGLPPHELLAFCSGIRRYPRIRIQGLMTVAPMVHDPAEVRPVFARLRSLAEQLRAQGWEHAPVNYLSMGMSNDYQIAIEEGAHFVRIGSAIFGRRPTTQV